MKFLERSTRYKRAAYTAGVIPAIALAVTLGACSGDRQEIESEQLSPAADSKNASGYQVVDVAGGGSISGRVTLADGAKVPEGFLSPSNQDICVGVETNNRLQPGPDGGVPWGIVYLEKVGSGKAFERGASGEILLDQERCQYLPHLVATQVGTKVAIRNGDPVPHNVRIEEPERDSILLNLVQPTQGRIDSFTVDRTGPLLVKCDYHVWMNAYLFGVDNPYYAVTGSDGSWSIDGIPPGTYSVVFWFNGPGIRPKREQTGKIVGYGFSEPIVERKQVTVAGGANQEVEFVLALTPGPSPR